MTNNTPQNFRVYGKTGSGDYGSSMGEQNTASIDVRKEKILDIVDTIPVRDKGHVYTIGDYGTADGFVSIPLIRDIIGRVRQRHGNVPVQVMYEDQPTNDFGSLFKRVYGLIPVPRTYLKDFSDVYVAATAAGFYQPVMPPESADVIFSFLAVQYLSKPATKFQDSFHRYPNATPEESRLVAAQAAIDWETFLLLRAKELRPGGILAVSMPADDPQKRVKGLRHCVQNPEEDMLKMWRRMRDEGKITQEEFVDTNFHRCCRYLEECTAPFTGSNSSVTKAGLQLIDAELVHLPCMAQLLWRERLEKEGVDDRESWARTVIRQHRCWSNWNFIRALSNTRSSDEKEALVDELYERLEREAVETNPEEYLNDSLLAFVFARKV